MNIFVLFFSSSFTRGQAIFLSWERYFLSSSFFFSPSYPFLHHHLVLPLFFPLLLKLVKARSSYGIARKKISSWLFNHHHTWCAKEENGEREKEEECARASEKEREKKKEVGLFFRIVVKWKCSLPGVELFFSLARAHSLSLFFFSFFFYYYMLVFSLAHSRGFSERDNWVRRKRSFPSNFFSHTHTHRHLARNGWYTSCIVWFASIYKHQVISASVGGA